jgi:2,3-dihydroxybiphenyl 1,2-dioxygenase
VEVFHGAVLDHSPVVTPYGASFVTGDQGLGHVVLPALDVNGLFEFYTEVLGFKSRGAFRVPAPPEFGPIRVRFMGVNQRHHSLAICPAQHLRDPGVIHLMVEVDTLDAVGQALDRVNAEGFQLSSTLGRHTNDKMVSFYVRAPGDWDIEFGTEGMLVDETYYTAEEITADSYWGHQWVSDLPAAMRP